jgi:quercetin dioxygenase-like cupin family protein
MAAMENTIESGEAVPDQPPISRVVVLDAVVSPMKQTSRVEVRRITMLPGFAAGFHVHNSPVVGSILEGSVLYQLDGEPASVLRAGDVFHEPEGVPVRFDATDEGATFLGYFLLSDGQDPEISMRA